MVSLGCDKNLCDSEAMLGLLAKHNYNITNDEQEADAIIVNTCSFIKDAMEESVNTVLEMAKLKQQNLKYLIVTGCMAQRFKDEIFDEIPEIDACLGTSSFDKILDVIEELKARDGIEDNLLLASLWIPTSITVAPSFTYDASIIFGFPIATIRISASLQISFKFFVLEWQIVTVAFSRSIRSAIGLPTILLLPITTQCFPSISISEEGCGWIPSGERWQPVYWKTGIRIVYTSGNHPASEAFGD